MDYMGYVDQNMVSSVRHIVQVVAIVIVSAVVLVLVINFLIMFFRYFVNR